MIKTILFCAVFALYIINISALDITTTDGKVYKNVQVTNVLPNAVGFMYTKKDGAMVLRDVQMTLLTKNLQKKFKYSPKKAEIFQKQVAVFQNRRNQLLQKHHKEDLALFRKHKEMSKGVDHIKAALYAHRIVCYVHITRSVGFNDCIGMITKRQSATSASGYGQIGSAYILDLTGPQNIRVSTTLYPTGENKSFEDGTFPVYTTNLNKYALELFDKRKSPSFKKTSTAPSNNMIFPANAPNKKRK